jgi:hypothetical protein
MHAVHLAGQSVFKHAVRKLVEFSKRLRNGYTVTM